jgi:molybdate transport system ATP-binding protein
LALDHPQGTSIVNRLPAVVTAVAATDTPGHVLVQLWMGESPLLARITERSRRELGIAPGLRLWVQIKGVALLS